ncbi:MAG: rhodanese-like domain-containing protein [Defluviitaleaceae bacterium]|nr:rhodanese-like domain-containing protein [Defluviitaleaceae bacterium]
MHYGYTPRRISPRQAQSLMQQKCIILDVRSPQEYSTGHIPGAVCLPENEIHTRASRILPDKNALILVYCKGGSRSKKAADALAAMGYTNVYDFGGINSWPYEIEQH